MSTTTWIIVLIIVAVESFILGFFAGRGKRVEREDWQDWDMHEIHANERERMTRRSR